MRFNGTQTQKYSRLKLKLIVVIIFLLVRGFNGSWWSDEELQWRDLEGNLVTWDFTNNQTSGDHLDAGGDAFLDDLAIFLWLSVLIIISTERQVQ